jgi:two-component system response regulator NreC
MTTEHERTESSRATLRPRTSTSKPRDATSSEPARILLVDDNDRILAHAVSALTQGYEIVGTARDGKAAVAAAEALTPDVIVIDISMPGMNGIELATSLRAHGSTAAFVFLSVHEEEEFIQASRDAGGLGYVVKARIFSDLELAVREARAGRPFQSPRW